MTTTDKAIKKVSKAEAMERIIAAISTLANMSGGLPEITEPLNEILKMTRLQHKMLEYRDHLLAEAERLIDTTVAANSELTKQRDAIALEMQQLIDDLKAGEFWDDDESDTKSDIYEAAMEHHNAAFWESLPYDMAHALGGDWQFWNADTLYNLITGDSFEVADGLGIDEEQVLIFRKKLLDMVREVNGRND